MLLIKTEGETERPYTKEFIKIKNYD